MKRIIDMDALEELKMQTLANIHRAEERDDESSVAVLEGRYFGLSLASLCIDEPDDELQRQDSARNGRPNSDNAADTLAPPETTEGRTEATRRDGMWSGTNCEDCNATGRQNPPTERPT